MAINISSNKLFPIRRDGQIASSQNGIFGGNGGGSSISVDALLKNAAKTAYTWDLPFVTSGDASILTYDANNRILYVHGDIRAEGDVAAYSASNSVPNWWNSMPQANASDLGGIKLGNGLYWVNGKVDVSVAAGGGASQWTTTGSDIYYNSGNVAIGATSANGRKLYVAGTATITQGALINDIKVNRSTGGANYPNYPDIYGTTTGIVIGGLSNGTGTVSFSTTGSATLPTMHLTTAGNVGIGTISPSYKFVISNGGANGIEFDPVNGHIFGYNRSGGGANTNLHFNTYGNVGVGTLNATRKFTLNDTAYPYMGFQENGTETWVIGSENGLGRGLIFYRSTGTAAYLMNLTTSGNLNVVGEVTAYYSSDERLKQNIKPLTSALDTLHKLQPKTFNWNDKGVELNNGKDTSSNQFGLIAQEVEKVLPELIHPIYEVYKGVDYVQLIPILIQAIQEQQKQINRLEKDLNIYKNNVC